MRIKVGDEVVVISGKDNGKTGSVIAVSSAKETVTVKGLNIVVKHVKKTSEHSGERIEKEAPIHCSNVLLLDGDKKASRVRYIVSKDGKKQRSFVTTGKLVSENFTKA